MSGRQERDHGATGHRRNRRGFGLDRSASLNRRAGKAERNGITHSRTGGRRSGSGASSLTNPGWLAYRYIIIGTSAAAFAFGISAIIVDWLKS